MDRAIAMGLTVDERQGAIDYCNGTGYSYNDVLATISCLQQVDFIPLGCRACGDGRVVNGGFLVGGLCPDCKKLQDKVNE